MEEEAKGEPGFLFTASGTNRLDQSTNFYLGEIGVSFSTPVDRRGKHVLFGNFMTGIGYEIQEVTNRVSSAEPGDHSGCSAPGSLDTSLSHAAGLIEIAACHA